LSILKIWSSLENHNEEELFAKKGTSGLIVLLWGALIYPFCKEVDQGEFNQYEYPLSYQRPKKRGAEVSFNVLWTVDCRLRTIIRDSLDICFNYWHHFG
tara:strand:- start:59 stop:355 length:297 start_codon:yes stop_codon:yes gene_type:complete